MDYIKSRETASQIDYTTENSLIRQRKLEVYTDGSKTVGSTGAGVYSEELDLKLAIRFDSNCSVFQSEVI